MEPLALQISGMSCGHCIASVRGALDRLEGVTVERVAVGSAAISFDPARTTPAAILDAVAAAGYEARVAAGVGAPA